MMFILTPNISMFSGFQRDTEIPNRAHRCEQSERAEDRSAVQFVTCGEQGVIWDVAHGISCRGAATYLNAREIALGQTGRVAAVKLRQHVRCRWSLRSG